MISVCCACTAVVASQGYVPVTKGTPTAGRIECVYDRVVHICERALYICLKCLCVLVSFFNVCWLAFCVCGGVAKLNYLSGCLFLVLCGREIQHMFDALAVTLNSMLVTTGYTTPGGDKGDQIFTFSPQ